MLFHRIRSNKLLSTFHKNQRLFLYKALNTMTPPSKKAKTTSPLPDHKINTPLSGKSKIIFNLLKPHSKLIIFGTAGLIFAMAAHLAMPSYIGRIIDEAQNFESRKIYLWGLAFSSVYLVSFASSFFRNYYFRLVSEMVILNLRKKLFAAVVLKPPTFFDKSPVGDLVSRLNSDVWLIGQSFAGENVSSGLRYGIQLGGSIAMMFHMSPKLAMPTLVMVLIVSVISRYYGELIKKLSQSVQTNLAESNSAATQSLSKIRTVKNFNRESYEISHYATFVQNVFGVSKTYAYYSSGYFSGTMLVGNIAFSAVLLYGIGLVSAGEITVGNLISFMGYCVYVGVAGRGLVSVYSELMKGLGASENVFRLLGKPVIDVSDLGHKSAFCEVINDISFENVSFSYENRLNDGLLSLVNVSFETGKKYALIGPSGSGKSTVLALICGLYSPNAGQILINGRDLSTLDLTQVRANIGIVSQDIDLVNGTILENILYGLPAFEYSGDAAEFKEIAVSAAVKAEAHDFIGRLPNGYETVIESNCSNLSGGEKQRIALARALVRDPSVLLFDEATSALDPTNRESVLNSIDKLSGKIIIFVTHSPELVRRCEEVILVDKASIRRISQPSERKWDLPNLFESL